jgi:hypothetical protein
MQTTITGLRHSLKEFEVGEPMAIDQPTGTRVVIDRVTEGEAPEAHSAVGGRPVPAVCRRLRLRPSAAGLGRA